MLQTIQIIGDALKTTLKKGALITIALTLLATIMTLIGAITLWALNGLTTHLIDATVPITLLTAAQTGLLLMLLGAFNASGGNNE